MILFVSEEQRFASISMATDICMLYTAHFFSHLDSGDDLHHSNSVKLGPTTVPRGYLVNIRSNAAPQGEEMSRETERTQHSHPCNETQQWGGGKTFLQAHIFPGTPHMGCHHQALQANPTVTTQHLHSHPC